MLRFESVRFRISQLNAPKAKNVAAAGTRRPYSAALDAFSGWPYGYPVRENVVADGSIWGRNIRRTFPDVGDLLGFCGGSGHDTITAEGRVPKQFPARTADPGRSPATAPARRSAAKSYFGARDMPAGARGNGNRHLGGAGEDPRLGLAYLHKMASSGRMDMVAGAAGGQTFV